MNNFPKNMILRKAKNVIETTLKIISTLFSPSLTDINPIVKYIVSIIVCLLICFSVLLIGFTIGYCAGYYSDFTSTDIKQIAESNTTYDSASNMFVFVYDDFHASLQVDSMYVSYSVVPFTFSDLMNDIHSSDGIRCVSTNNTVVGNILGVVKLTTGYLFGERAGKKAKHHLIINKLQKEVLEYDFWSMEER